MLGCDEVLNFILLTILEVLRDVWNQFDVLPRCSKKKRRILENAPQWFRLFEVRGSMGTVRMIIEGVANYPKC